MKQKIKEFSKKYLVGFIIGSILFGTLGVYAVTYFPGLNTTYDNSDSGMTSTNVQDALDELYSVCVPSASDQIIEDAGLEKDPYECRYFFTGGNPNNYITFNDEKAGWRIISVECDGTIKIIRNESIENQKWDTSGSNNWARPSSLNTYLNEDYYNNKLNTIAKSQIVTHDWSIGAVTYDNNDLVDQINDENGTKWNGKVALATVSEYIRSNSNKSSCGSFSLNNDNYDSINIDIICTNKTWMYGSFQWWWTLSYRAGTSNKVLGIHPAGHINSSDVDHYEEYAVRPALYLSSDIKITGGTGTQSDPYTIE